jgi:hypothetical protein
MIKKTSYKIYSALFVFLFTTVFSIHSNTMLIDNDYGVPKMQKNALKNLDVKVLKIPNSSESSEKFCKDNAVHLKKRMMLTYTANGLEFVVNPYLRQINKICKNKLIFRNRIKDLYPDFFYKAVKYENLKKIDYKSFSYPIIIKPIRGYSSIGVYKVENEDQWLAVCKKLEKDNEIGKSVVSHFVFDSSFYLIEEALEGEEVAVDGYYSDTGKPVILDIMKRMFVNTADTSDRIYYTSTSIINETLDETTELAKKLGKTLDIKLFPFHLEARRNKSGELIPIEINPMRFAGVGVSDLSFYAFGINNLEYYFSQKEPNWEKIIERSDDSIYGFYCAEFSKKIDYDDIAYVKEAELKSKFKNVIEYRNTLTRKSGIFFALIFYKASDIKENVKLLQLNLDDFIVLKSQNKYDWLTSFKDFFKRLNPLGTVYVN